MNINMKDQETFNKVHVALVNSGQEPLADELHDFYKKIRTYFIKQSEMLELIEYGER